MYKYIVKNEDKGKRLDRYVTEQNAEITRTAVQRLIDEKNILVNGKEQKLSYKVNENERDSSN